MGNCINHQRVVTWVDDEDWEYSEEFGNSSRDQCQEDEDQAAGKVVREENELLVGKGGVPLKDQVVKIKITKKQLEELLRRVDAKGIMTIQQQLRADLMNMKRDTCLQERGQQYYWRPALQSIPE